MHHKKTSFKTHSYLNFNTIILHKFNQQSVLYLGFAVDNYYDTFTDG